MSKNPNGLTYFIFVVQQNYFEKHFQIANSINWKPYLQRIFFLNSALLTCGLFIEVFHVRLILIWIIEHFERSALNYFTEFRVLQSNRQGLKFYWNLSHSFHLPSLTNLLWETLSNCEFYILKTWCEEDIFVLHCQFGLYIFNKGFHVPLISTWIIKNFERSTLDRV